MHRYKARLAKRFGVINRIITDSFQFFLLNFEKPENERLRLWHYIDWRFVFRHDLKTTPVWLTFFFCASLIFFWPSQSFST